MYALSGGVRGLVFRFRKTVTTRSAFRHAKAGRLATMCRPGNKHLAKPPDCLFRLGRWHSRISRSATVAACLLLGSGCTSLQWTDMAPDVLREQVRTGELVQVGDKVGVVGKDGAEDVIKIVAVREDSIVGRHVWGHERWGEDVEIDIDEIVALRTARLDEARTTAATMVGVGVGTYALALGLLILAWL